MTAYPYQQERAYQNLLEGIVRDLIEQTVKNLLRAYAEALTEAEAELAPVRRDAWPTIIETAISRIRLGVNEKVQAGKRVLRLLAAEVASENRRAFWRSFTGVDALGSEARWLNPLMQSWVKENSALITSIPEQYLQRVGQRTHDLVRQGMDVREYAKELEKTYDLTRSRARLIARTEVSKLNGQISRARSMKAGLNEYEWLTSGDERVRPSHRALDGMICRWDDPSVFRRPGEGTPWESRATIGGYIGIPGGDYQCRCTAGARVEDYINSLLGEAA